MLHKREVLIANSYHCGKLMNVGRRTDIPEPVDWTVKTQRLITAGPLYPIDDVQELLGHGVIATSLFTTDAGADAADECLSLADVIKIVKEAIEHGRYKNSQWCRHSSEGPFAPCDAYSIRRKNISGVTSNFYVKFAISRTGALLLIFSCHS